MSLYVGVAQCELLSAQLDNKMSLLEIFKLVPFGGSCFSISEFLLCEAFLKIFAGWLFAFAVRELIKI